MKGGIIFILLTFIGLSAHAKVFTPTCELIQYHGPSQTGATDQILAKLNTLLGMEEVVTEHLLLVLIRFKNYINQVHQHFQKMT